MDSNAVVLIIWLAVCGVSLGQDGKNSVTFDDFLTGRYGQRGFGGSWTKSDEELQFQDGEGNVVILNVRLNETSVLVPNAILTQFSAQTYVVSPDRQFVLISYDTRAQFRHSTTARYVVASLLGDGAYIPLANSSFLQTAKFGPVGNSIIYVLDNNIYYTPNISVEAVPVTDSGVPGVVYNGVPDWVYEEEVLGAGTAYWISPQGRWLIYLEFEDRDVPEMEYFLYGSPGTIEDQYPTSVKIRYPKAGAVNPNYSAYLVDLTNPQLNKTLLSTKEADGVTYGFTWAREDKYAELLMSRVQNESWLNVTSIDGKINRVFHTSNPRGWITTTSYIFDPSGISSLSIESRNVGTAGNYSHLILRDTEGDGSDRILTTGEFVVLSIIGWDQKTDSIYYTATEEKKPYVSQVYVISSKGGTPTCISCPILTPEGNPCSSASARFSAEYTYILLTCSAPDPTVIALYRNEKILQDPLIVFQDNSDLRSALKNVALPSQFDTTVDIDGGFVAQVRLQLPCDFDETKKYPLLINVYGGPDSNQIINGFSVGWGAYLTSNLSIIYGFIDGRGSGRSGDDILFAGYRALGTVEIDDQINVTRQIQERYPWIDADRTAIWGWSYGGYATGRALERDTYGVFKCGISVAPVTSWLYYDSVYTERYMGLPTPEDNLKAYQDGDLVSNVENLKNKKYYLIHGNGDDNVHYQQSMMLSRALELGDVIFQQQSYPDENHSLGGVTRHLYHSMDKFWKDCFEL